MRAARFRAIVQQSERTITYLAVFLAPFALLRFTELFFTVSDLLFFISIGLLVLLGRVPQSPFGHATSLWVIAVSLLCGALFLSGVLHGDLSRSAIVTAQYLFAYLALPLVLTRDPLYAKRLALTLVLSIVIIDIHGIFTFYFVGYVPGETKGVVSGSLRLATVLRNPNLAAAMNALCLPILLYFWVTGVLPAFLGLACTALVLVTVVLTSSNSGLIAVVTGLVVFLASIMTRRLLIQLIIVLSLCAPFLYFLGTDILPATFQRRVLGALTSGDVSEAGTFLSRAELMKEAFHVISARGLVLTGIGPDQFRTISVQEAPVHNIYLLLWVEGGVFAVIGWMCIPGTAILLAIYGRRAGLDKHVSSALFSTALVVLIVGISNPHMYARYWTMPIFLAAGLLMSRLREWERSESSFTGVKAPDRS